MTALYNDTGRRIRASLMCFWWGLIIAAIWCGPLWATQIALTILIVEWAVSRIKVIR